MTETSESLITRARELGADAEVWTKSSTLSSLVCRGGVVERRSDELRQATAMTTWRDGQEGYAIHAPLTGPHLVDQALAVGAALGRSDFIAPALAAGAASRAGAGLFTDAVSPAGDTDASSGADLENTLMALSHAFVDAEVELRATTEQFTISSHRSGTLPQSYRARTQTVQARITVHGDRVGYISHEFHAPTNRDLTTQLHSELHHLVADARTLAESPATEFEFDAVLLHGRIAGSLLELIAPAFQQDTVLEGRSPLEGLVGKSIGESHLRLVDDPLSATAPLSMPWDDEGTEVRRTVLIEDGVLRGFLNSRRTTGGSDGARTGNGWRGPSGEMPTVQYSNLQVEMATSPDLGERRGQVLYVIQANGAHISNGITGDFSIGANALLLCSDGRRRNVGQISVAGNVFDLFKNITGHDGRVSVGGGGRSFLGAPGLWVDGLVIGR